MILHLIAAVLWLFALLLAFGLGVMVGEKSRDRLEFTMIAALVLATIAFILQVMA